MISFLDVVCFYDWIISFVERFFETRNENAYLTCDI